MLKRNIEKKLNHYLKVFPVVLVTGARQTGKTTIVKKYSETHPYEYLSLDDISTLLAAKEDPIGFLRGYDRPLIIDEVQRAPELFLAIKLLVDEKQTNGQYILTGSANPLFLPKVGDSLAGRMGILNIFPFSQGELVEQEEDFLSWIFSPDFSAKEFADMSLDQLGNKIYKGGFPKILSLQSNEAIETWIEGYLDTLMTRDIKDIAQIEGVYHFPSLLNLLARRSGSLFNGADIARTLNISTSSVHRYLTLLETIFLLYREHAWFSNHAKRIAKAPKIYFCDSGILSYLLKMDKNTYQSDPAVFGFLLESFIASELLKQASWADEKISQFHFRDGSNEVDIVLEQRGGKIVGVEVKKAETIRPADFKGLKRLKSIAKDKFVQGIVLYPGDKMVPFGDQLWAIPISSLWSVTKESASS